MPHALPWERYSRPKTQKVVAFCAGEKWYKQAWRGDITKTYYAELNARLDRSLNLLQLDATLAMEDWIGAAEADRQVWLAQADLLTKAKPGVCFQRVQADSKPLYARFKRFCGWKHFCLLCIPLPT